MLSDDIRALGGWIERRSSNGSLGREEAAAVADRLRTLADQAVGLEARPVIVTADFRPRRETRNGH